MWSIWDKKSPINGVPAERFLGRIKLLQGEDTIYIKTVDGCVTNVEGKNILASNFDIDPSLPDEEFIAEYERIIATPEIVPEESINT